MDVITLDAKNWDTALDFYDALLAGLGAPDWHGRCIAALIDSMVAGNINLVAKPYRVVVIGLAKCGEDAFDELIRAFAALARYNNHSYITGNEAWLEVI